MNLLPSSVDPRNSSGRNALISTASGAAVAMVVYKKMPGGQLVKVAVAAAAGLFGSAVTSTMLPG